MLPSVWKLHASATMQTEAKTRVHQISKIVKACKMNVTECQNDVCVKLTAIHGQLATRMDTVKKPSGVGVLVESFCFHKSAAVC